MRKRSAWAVKYTKESLIKALGVNVMPEEFGKNFDKTMAEYDEFGAMYLSDEFIDNVQSEFHIFEEKLAFVKEEAKRVRENELLARYSMLLRQMLRDKDRQKLISLPEVPVGETEQEKVDLEMAAYFALFSFIPEMAEYYRARKIPENVIRDTFRDPFEGGIKICNGRFGRDGYETNRSFLWTQHYVSYNIIRIGVLNFHLCPSFIDVAKVFVNDKGECRILSNNQSVSERGQVTGSPNDPDEAFVAEFKETEDAFIGYEVDTFNCCVTKNKVELKKNEWRLLLKEDDSVIHIHIPEVGGFTKDKIEEAYRDCLEIFGRSFPEFEPKVFACFSWLMDPQLREILGEKSNIVGFQSKFKLFPRKSSGKGVYTFLFRVNQDTPIEEFPEKSSLQRKVKEIYLAGGNIYEPCGIFLFDDVER